MKGLVRGQGKVRQTTFGGLEDSLHLHLGTPLHGKTLQQKKGPMISAAFPMNLT
jgi:hypothetical protein